MFGGRCLRRRRTLCVVWVIGNFLQPLHTFAIHHAGHSQVSHGACRCCTVPVLDARWADDHVSRADFLHGLAPFLSQAHTCDHHQSLACWMGMPGRTRARLEGNVGAGCIDFASGGKQGIDAHPPGEIIRRPRCRSLCTCTADLLGSLGLTGIVCCPAALAKGVAAHIAIPNRVLFMMTAP